MVPGEVGLYRVEKLAFLIRSDRPTWDVDDARIADNVSPRQTAVQEVLGGLRGR